MTSQGGNASRRQFLQTAGAIGLFTILPSRARASQILRVADMVSQARRSLLKASGLDKDLPYEVEWSLFPAGAPELEALGAGAIDYGQVGDTPFLTAASGGLPGRVTGIVTFRPRQIELLVSKNSDAASIADLKGKKIAVNRGGTPHLFLLALLEKHGLTPDDISVAFLGPIDAKPAFSQGAVDAWIAWPHYSTLAIAQDGARPIADLTDLPPGVTVAEDYLFAHENAIANKRELIVDFQKRIYASLDWALANPAEAAKIIARDTKLPAELVEEFRATIVPTPGHISDETIRNAEGAIAVFARHGLLKPFEAAPLFDKSFS